MLLVSRSLSAQLVRHVLKAILIGLGGELLVWNNSLWARWIAHLRG